MNNTNHIDYFNPDFQEHFPPLSGESTDFPESPRRIPQLKKKLSQQTTNSEKNKLNSNNNMKVLKMNSNIFVPTNAKPEFLPQNIEKRTKVKDDKEIVDLILNLSNIEKREESLRELHKKRETCPYLASYLWHSIGTTTILLQEIIGFYELVTPPVVLTITDSVKLCNIIGLLQTIALDPETKHFLMEGA